MSGTGGNALGLAWPGATKASSATYPPESTETKPGPDTGQEHFYSTISPMGPLFGPALRIALETGRSAYDGLYLALAEALSCQAVTADRRLYNALQGGPYAGRIRWVKDGP
jgi:hypothetical protein